jgi:hypothetical protein
VKKPKRLAQPSTPLAAAHAPATRSRPGGRSLSTFSPPAAGHDLCANFAGRGEDKFAWATHAPGCTGAPILVDTLG